MEVVIRYEFECSICGRREVHERAAHGWTERNRPTLADSKAGFVLDSSWEEWPEGWVFMGNDDDGILECPTCVKHRKEIDEMKKSMSIMQDEGR